MKCDLDSISVHYEVFGKGKPILFIHGFSCDRRLMMGCMEPIFSQRPGWQRIYIDLPGMGLTKGKDWIKCSDDMLEVVDRFVDKVLDGKRFVLAGESYGGYLSRGLLAKRNEQIDGMLLICPSAGRANWDAPSFKVISKDETFLMNLQDNHKEEFITTQVVQDSYNWIRFENEILSGLTIADSSFLERIKLQYDLTTIPNGPGYSYDKPVLILVGRQDHMVGYRNQWKFVEEYPRASFVLLDRAGHNLQIEQNQLFNPLVNEWLDRIMESLQ